MDQSRTLKLKQKLYLSFDVCEQIQIFCCGIGYRINEYEWSFFYASFTSLELST